jgi:hypothetical protein
MDALTSRNTTLGNVDAINRAVTRQHGRARVLNRSTGAPIALADMFAVVDHPTAPRVFAKTVAQSTGLYAAGGITGLVSRLLASAQDYSAALAANLESDNNAIVDVQFFLVPTGTLTGFVRDSLGFAVGGAAVYANQVDSPKSGGNSTLTAADGSYTLSGLDADSIATPEEAVYQITAYVFGRMEAIRTNVTVRSNQTVSLSDLVLLDAAKISGRVTAIGGSGVAGATVSCRQVTGSLSWFDYGLTDPAGYFTIGGIDIAGDYEVAVFSDGYSMRETLVSVVPGQAYNQDF